MNIGSMTPYYVVQKNLNASLQAFNVASQRIATGRRIVRAADDPAGMAVTQKLESRIRGMNVARRDLDMGINLLRTAESTVGNLQQILQDIEGIITQSLSDTLSPQDRQILQSQLDDLVASFDDVAGAAEYNGRVLFDGSLAYDTVSKKHGLSFLSGSDPDQRIGASIAEVSSTALGIDSLDATDLTNAAAAKADVAEAMSELSKLRTNIGVSENRFNHIKSHLGTAAAQLTHSKSIIEDADIALEPINLMRAQAQGQASMFALAAYASHQRNMMFQLLDMRI